MSATRAIDERRRMWWRDPAWLSLFLTLLLHMCVAAYIYGRLAEQVDMLQRQTDVIMEHILQQHSGAPKP